MNVVPSAMKNKIICSQEILFSSDAMQYQQPGNKAVIWKKKQLPPGLWK